MQGYKKNFAAALAVLVIASAVLIVRLWYLQILNGEEYERFSKSNRIRLVRIPAPRGRILDREGRELVTNRPSFDLYANPEDVKDVNGLALNLSAVLGMTPDSIKSRLSRRGSYEGFGPVLIAKDLNRDQLAFIEVRRSSTLSGVYVELSHVRQYPAGTLGSSFLGYMGRVSERELAEIPGIHSDDLIGKSGVEKSFDAFLRGRDGFRQRSIDALGREVKSTLFQKDLLSRASTPGNDVVLSIDMELQREAEDALRDHSGAIVVVDVNTGEVLALASRPSFDPSQFATGIDPKRWQALIEDPYHPLINRATQGAYPPGSVFKIITALAALEEGVISPDTSFNCPGNYRLGNQNYMCWKRSGHGWVNLHSAIVESCDVFFYKTVEKLGIDRLSHYMDMFGLGKITELGISERPGVAPSRAWKLKQKRLPWYRGDTIVTGIGQGYLATTPIQVAMATAAVANGGKLLKPILVKRVLASDGRIVEDYETKVRFALPIAKAYIDAVKAAMEGVVNEPQGTGRAARLDKILVSGKTGTAQVVSNPLRVEHIREHEDHAWFTSFAPSRNPEIAVTVFVEHGGKGGAVAAPIAKRVLEFYFKQKAGGSV
jgi:penicillin-binding protein 2